MTEERRPDCPVCGQPGIRIAYGYPSHEMGKAADAGEIVLGGCEVWDGMPTWQCSQGHEWNDTGTPTAPRL